MADERIIGIPDLLKELKERTGSDVDNAEGLSLMMDKAKLLIADIEKDREAEEIEKDHALVKRMMEWAADIGTKFMGVNDDSRNVIDCAYEYDLLAKYLKKEWPELQWEGTSAVEVAIRLLDSFKSGLPRAS